MYKYHKEDHKSSHICECENRSLTGKTHRRDKERPAAGGLGCPCQSSEMAVVPERITREARYRHNFWCLIGQRVDTPLAGSGLMSKRTNERMFFLLAYLRARGDRILGAMNNQTFYQFKVALRGISPPIRR